MTRIIFPFALMIALMITGCASSLPQTAAATPTLPATADEWTVKMIHSGGIMGLMRSVEVSSDGNYTVTDERANNTVISKLNNTELAKLSGIITTATLLSPEISGPHICADCFIYDIEIQNGGKNFTIQLSDLSLPGSGMEELVASLRGLMDSALK